MKKIQLSDESKSVLHILTREPRKILIFSVIRLGGLQGSTPCGGFSFLGQILI